MIMHYLDYNATAPVKPAVLETMRQALEGGYNASSVHANGRQARSWIEGARRQVAGLVNADPKNVIFTSSATEANNWVLKTLAPQECLVSAIEHPSVERTAGVTLRIPVTPDGLIELTALENMLAAAPKGTLISVMLANNETGVIQPVSTIVDMVRRHGMLIHCDAVQAVGRIPVDLQELGVDFLTVAAHKMGGPIGAAALVLGSCMPVTPFFSGGGQESNRRAGTENVAAIMGFGKACELAKLDMEYSDALRIWRDALEAEVKRACPDAVIFGQDAPRLPNTTCITMPGVSNETQLMHCDLQGIAVSAGSACTSGKIEPSHVLKAMGISEAEAATTIRISSGWATTEKDYEAILSAWKQLYERCRQKKAA